MDERDLANSYTTVPIARQIHALAECVTGAHPTDDRSRTDDVRQQVTPEDI